MEKACQKPYIPEYWSNPQSIIAYMRAGRKSLLNIIPPSVFEQGHTTFPSRMGNTHYVTDPGILRVILKTRANEFPKSRANNLLLEPFVPESIFIAKDANWREMHDIMIPVFNASNVNSFEPIIHETLDQFLAQNDLSNAGTKDITPFIQDLTYRIISQILVSDSEDENLNFLREIFEHFLNSAGRIQYWDILAIRYEYLPNFRNFTNMKMRKSFQKLSLNIVRNRLKEKTNEKHDFLELLINAYDLRSNPTSQSVRIVADNLITFLIAGHETTAMAISWGLYALSYFKEAQDQIATESDLPAKDMRFTDSALKEIMRLYPPAPMISRRSMQYERFGDLEIKPNEGIILPIIASHRHIRYWEKPNEFIADRFLDFTPKPMTYLPFGAGPRICIGANFAMLEAKIILSRLIKTYNFHPSEHQPSASLTLTLRSKNGLKINIEKRST